VIGKRVTRRAGLIALHVTASNVTCNGGWGYV
jgi:hypothetical protein